MKKMNIFKIALTLVLAFVITGAFAQIPADYSETQLTEAIMYQTVGGDFGLYVEPDANFSPAYAGSGTIGAGVQWTWTFAAGLGTATVTSGVAQGLNYVEFADPTIGNGYTVDVVESNALCASATTITQTINVIAAPTATITTADILVPAACGNQAAETVSITFVENVPDALAGFAFAVREYVETIDGLGVQVGVVSDNTTFVNETLASKAVLADFTGASSTPNFYYEFTTSSLDVSGGLRTRYTYTLLEASDAGTGTDGVISAISQKSQYIDGLATYPFTDNQVVFIVNPAPVTGPIYHIANDFNL